MINTGTSLKVLEDKGTINFRVNDIFRGMKFAFNLDRQFVQDGQFNYESQTAYIGFNYRFSSKKKQRKTAKKTR